MGDENAESGTEDSAFNTEMKSEDIESGVDNG